MSVSSLVRGFLLLLSWFSGAVVKNMGLFIVTCPLLIESINPCHYLYASSEIPGQFQVRIPKIAWFHQPCWDPTGLVAITGSGCGCNGSI